MAERDIEAFTLNAVAAISTIHVGPFDDLSGKAFNLADLGFQGMACRFHKYRTAISLIRGQPFQ